MLSEELQKPLSGFCHFTVLALCNGGTCHGGSVNRCPVSCVDEVRGPSNVGLSSGKLLSQHGPEDTAKA